MCANVPVLKSIKVWAACVQCDRSTTTQEHQTITPQDQTSVMEDHCPLYNASSAVQRVGIGIVMLSVTASSTHARATILDNPKSATLTTKSVFDRT
eukprot:m.150185 g.150185  ORF g.150185 m.150185 type:complete len:96 (-) comp17825_c0_seq37:1773-2060(-)